MERQIHWRPTLVASQHEAIFAVRIYNEGFEPRFFETFVVHMHLAWLYLLHARLVKHGYDIRYRDPNDARRYQRVDGEYRLWELATCVSNRWPSVNDPVRRNLDFFIAFRNRIELRHEKMDAELRMALGGRVRALLLNYENELRSEFGEKYSLATQLSFPVFIGSFTDSGEDTVAALQAKLSPSLRNFIAKFDSGIPEDVINDQHFDMRLNVVLNQVNRGADAMAIQFTRWDDLTEEQKIVIAELGKRGHTIVREQTRSVVGHGLLKAREIERTVAEALPYVFNSHHLLRAWQIKEVRPKLPSSHPERTDERYCVYDELSNSYGYKNAWARWLIEHCKTAAGFEAVTGRKPELKN